MLHGILKSVNGSGTYSERYGPLFRLPARENIF